MSMEEWLSEMEIDLNIEDSFYNNANNHSSMEDLDALSEELQLFLGEAENPSLLLQCSSSPPPLNSNDNDNDNNNNNQNNNDDDPSNPTNLGRSLSSEQVWPITCDDNVETDLFNSPQQNQKSRDDDQNEKERKQDVANGKRRKKREASQAEVHILAERNRRQLHAQRFIALTAIVPGLLKVDKNSILERTIDYIKELQLKVKNLEEAMPKQHMESIVAENDDDAESERTIKENVSLSVVETKISNGTLIFRIRCDNRNEIISKIIAKVEKYEIKILNTNILHLGSTFDITIVTQMEKVDNKLVKILVKHLHSLLRLM